MKRRRRGEHTLTQAAITLPHAAPYTVDDLFEIPDDGHRYEVFGGSLVMSPAAAPLHQLVADELRSFLYPLVRPHRALAIGAVTIRVTDEDGPIPDVAVVSADVLTLTGAVPLDEAHTVIEVVSPSSVLMDRSLKAELYVEAGIPCYWRVELKPSRRYQGPLPLVVVRALEKDGETWRTIEAPAGATRELPVAVGPDSWITVSLDPAELVDP
jgi:Uma2 family endonuclease